MRRAGRKRATRGGWTLLEMAFLGPVAAVLLTTVTVLLASYLRADQRQRQTLESHQAIARLADQFRADAAAALGASAGASETLALRSISVPLVRLELPDGGEIVYRAGEDGLIRVERRGAAEEVARERFRLPEGTAWRLSVEPDSSLALLEIEYPLHRQQDASRRTLRVVAPLRSDLRWSAARQKQEESP